MVRESLEQKGRRESDTRLLDWLIPSHLVTVGESDQYRASGHGRREHVVPRLVILRKCHEMVDREPLEAIADVIARHTRIVRVSIGEQVALDSHGGRQRMPIEDWPTGGDIFARLVGMSWQRLPAFYDLQAFDPTH